MSDTETKVCKSCGVEKNLNDYPHKQRRSGKIYIAPTCKQCKNARARENYDPEKKKAYCVRVYEQTIIKRRINYLKNRESIIANVCAYKKLNRDKINARAKERRQQDPIFQLREATRTQIKKALKGNKRGSSITNYLIYTIEDLKKWIEKLFSHPDNLIDGQVWMKWENHGKYNTKTWNDNDPNTWTWQLDHIIPQSDLPYDSMEHPNFKKCWELNNLRPLSAKQNAIDGATRIRHRKVT